VVLEIALAYLDFELFYGIIFRLFQFIYMWFEKRLIGFAGPPEGLKSQAPDDDKEKERRFKDGTKEDLHVQEEAVGKSAIEQNEKPKSPFDGIKDFEKRFDSVRSQFATLEKLGLKERAEVIVNIRRRIMELKFLMRYLAENEFVEVVDGHLIYNEGENSKLDLTASAEEIAASYIQNAEAKFDGKAIEGGHYSVRFLAYVMDRFNLFAEHSGKNPNLNKVVEKYAALRGIELKVDKSGTCT